jgi:hypothetical protein
MKPFCRLKASPTFEIENRRRLHFPQLRFPIGINNIINIWDGFAIGKRHYAGLS